MNSPHLGKQSQEKERFLMTSCEHLDSAIPEVRLPWTSKLRELVNFLFAVLVYTVFLLFTAQECWLMHQPPSVPGKMKQAQRVHMPSREGPPDRKPYLVFQGSLLDGAHPVASVLLTQAADEANRLPVVLAEEQLDLLHVTLTLRQGLGAQAGHLWALLLLVASSILPWDRGLMLAAAG